MTVPRASTILAATLVVCACALMAEGAKFNWRENAKVKEYLKNSPLARRMTQSPIGGIIDIVIDIILILLSIIFGEPNALLTQMNETRQQMAALRQVLGI